MAEVTPKTMLQTHHELRVGPCLFVAGRWDLNLGHMEISPATTPFSCWRGSSATSHSREMIPNISPSRTEPRKDACFEVLISVECSICFSMLEGSLFGLHHVQESIVSTCAEQCLSDSKVFSVEDYAHG